MNNKTFNKILSSKNIVDYLHEQGINPLKNSGDKHLYRCPLPHHKNDNDPSFCVYEKGDYQDYYCFGCGSGGTIIQLIAAIEDRTIRDVIKYLAEGCNISIDDELEQIILDILNVDEKQELKDDIIDYYLLIGIYCKDFLRKVNFNSNELNKCEIILQQIDKAYQSKNYEYIVKIYDNLPETLNKRLKLLNGIN